MTMSGDMDRKANLRAIQRMLAYAMVEIRREDLAEVVELLATAQLMIGKVLRQGAPQPGPAVSAAEQPKIRLATSREAHYAEGNETKV